MSTSGSNDADTAPWADLLPELCNLILDRLDAVSVIRFAAVCTKWAAAASENNHCRPRLWSGAPTLIKSSQDLECEGYNDVEYDMEPGIFGLHDVGTGKSYHGEAEGLKNRTWIGGKDDWLVTTDWMLDVGPRCSVELLNPITGVRVALPSFATIPGVETEELFNRHPVVAFETSMQYFQKVTLCRTPAHPSGYLAVALFSPYDDSLGLLAFTAAGDERWTPLKNPERRLYYRRNKYTDVTVHKGKVLAVATSGDIYSWDMDGGTTAEPAVLPPPVIDIDIDIDIDSECSTMRVFYLATSSGGDLQLICMFGYHDHGKDDRWRRIVFDFEWSFWPRRVLLHELDAVTGAWRRVEDLGGGRALFVGANYPFYADVPTCDGSRDPLLRADCVYVADLINCDAGIFDLKLGYDFQLHWDAHLWYPAITDALQMPMWFRPTAALPESTSARSIEERQTLLL